MNMSYLLYSLYLIIPVFTYDYGSVLLTKRNEITNQMFNTNDSISLTSTELVPIN